MFQCDSKQLNNAILWAAAIIASAISGAPVFFTIILLPALGLTSILANSNSAGT